MREVTHKPRFFAYTQYARDPPFDKTQLQFGDIVMTHHPRVQFTCARLEFFQCGKLEESSYRRYGFNATVLVPLYIAEKFDKSQFAQMSIAAFDESKAFRSPLYEDVPGFDISVSIGVEVALDDKDLLAICDKIDYAMHCSHIVFIYNRGVLTSIEFTAKVSSEEEQQYNDPLHLDSSLIDAQTFPFLIQNCKSMLSFAFHFSIDYDRMWTDTPKIVASKEDAMENSKNLMRKCAQRDWEKLRAIEKQCNNNIGDKNEAGGGSKSSSSSSEPLRYCCAFVHAEFAMKMIVCFERGEEGYRRIKAYHDRCAAKHCWTPREFERTEEERAVLQHVYQVLRQCAYLQEIYQTVQEIDL